MAKEEFEKPSNDYDKPTLVHTVSLLLNLHDMMGEANKLSKKALWRIFDSYQERGNAFANLEDRIRKLERELLESKTRTKMAEDKLAKMEKNRRGKNSKSH